MKDVLAYIFPLGKPRPEDVTGATNFSESTTEHRITCPADKIIWVLFGGVNRDTSATLDIRVMNSANKRKLVIIDNAAGTGWGFFPNAANAINIAYTPTYMILIEGDYLQFQFSVAQGAAAEIHVQCLEVDLKQT